MAEKGLEISISFKKSLWFYLVLLFAKLNLKWVALKIISRKHMATLFLNGKISDKIYLSHDNWID